MSEKQQNNDEFEIIEKAIENIPRHEKRYYDLLKIPIKINAKCEVTVGRRTLNLIFKDFNQQTYAFLFEDEEGNQYLIPYKNIKMLKVMK